MKRFFVAVARNGYRKFIECELPQNVAVPSLALYVSCPQDYEIFEITEAEYNVYTH
jgi:hypothetical protein